MDGFHFCSDGFIGACCLLKHTEKEGFPQHSSNQCCNFILFSPNVTEMYKLVSLSVSSLGMCYVRFDVHIKIAASLSWKGG